MCDLTGGKLVLCRKWIGSILGAFIGQIEDVESVTSSNGTISAMTMKTGKQAYRFDVEHETSNFGEVVTSNRQNGTVVSVQTLTLMNNDYEVATRNTGMELTQGKYFAVIRYTNGKFKVAGFSVDSAGNVDLDSSGGLMSTTQTHNSGTAKEDKNGDDWVFEAKENCKVLAISKSIAESLLTATS